jgi:hypothetical protein
MHEQSKLHMNGWQTNLVTDAKRSPASECRAVARYNSYIQSGGPLYELENTVTRAGRRYYMQSGGPLYE